MLKRSLLLAGITLLGFGCAAAHADTVSDADGSTYTLTYSPVAGSPGSYDVFLTVDTTGYTFYAGNPAVAVSPNYLQAVALELDPLQGSTKQPSVSLISASAGFTDLLAGKDTANGCNSSSAKFFCDQYATNDLGAPAGGTGDVYNFEFLVTVPTGGELDFDPGAATVEANYNYTTTNKSGTVDHNGELANASITLTAATPEPSSLALLGTTVLGAAGMLRRRFKA